MKQFLLTITFGITLLLASDIDSLLKEYDTTTQNSLSTVDEKLGHVIIYSQKELRLMQYDTLNEVLKELSLNNLNKNRLGVQSLSVPGSKSDVSGFFRLFINDHEVSSAYTQSPALSWGNLPLDFIDHIEVYHGNSSFALGSETGIFFIRVYTKKPQRENGTELKTGISTHGSNTQSIMHSETLANGWSFLAFANNETLHDSAMYKNNRIDNDSKRQYFYVDAQKNDTRINLGYSSLNKDNYLGLAFDANPENGEIASQDYFVDVTNYFLDDKSIKVNFSLDINDEKYDEENSSGMALIPNIDLTNFAATVPKKYERDVNLRKINTFVSKKFNSKNNNFLLAANYVNKKYNTSKNDIVNLMNQNIQLGSFTDFDEESIYSLMIQDDYKINENWYLIGNAKLDHYKRSGFLKDFTEEQYRLGTIITPFENFGLKSFYTKTHLPPTFYNIDYADKNQQDLKTQQYKFYAIEGVYAKDKSKFTLIYNNVKIDDFIYYSPVGFINIDHRVTTEGLSFDYEYEINDNSLLKLNYFTTKLSENINNSNKGGFIKYMGEKESFEYFASLVYRNNYTFKDVRVPSSYDLNMGITYHISKNVSLKFKGQNLLNKSTESLYQDGFPTGTDFSLKDRERLLSFSIKWRF